MTSASDVSRHVTSPSDVTSTSEDVSADLGVQLTVGRRLKHIAMKATFDQPRKKDCSHEFYAASELLESFVVDRRPQPTATVVQAVELPLSTLIVVGSPFSHTVHYINADARSPSSASNLSSSSSDSSSSSSAHVSRDKADEPACSRPHDVMSTTDSCSVDERRAAALSDLTDLDELREADLLPLPPPCSTAESPPWYQLPLCSGTESPPWYLGLTDDELRCLLLDPDTPPPPPPVTLDDVVVGDLISSTELSSSASPCSDADASAPCKFDYSTPEVVELLGSLYDDWLRDDELDNGSFFSPL